MAYIFTIIFISKLVSVEMACLLVIQNKKQALCAPILKFCFNSLNLTYFIISSCLSSSHYVLGSGTSSAANKNKASLVEECWCANGGKVHII